MTRNPILSVLPSWSRYSASVLAHTVRYSIENSSIIAGPAILKMNVPRVIAGHFPKAGGSSLIKQFSYFLRSQLAMDFAGDPLAGTAGTRAFPKGKSMVIGHFHPGRYDSIDAFRMTMLRHPVNNLISKYYFWRSVPDRGHPVHNRFIREHPSIVDFAYDRRIRYLMSQTYFGGFDMGRFDFIGFDETRVEDLQALSLQLGIPISAEVHINRTCVGDEYLAAQNDQVLRAALTDILAIDVAFYDGLRAQAARR